MKGKALRKHSLHEKTAASVLLKLFISGNEWCLKTNVHVCTKLVHILTESYDKYYSQKSDIVSLFVHVFSFIIHHL